MSEQSFNTNPENEISLKDIIDFLVESWKKILLSGVAGGLLGLGYVVKVPAKYQATANIQPAKVAGIDVETAAVLIEKLKMPMFYSQKTYAACGVIESLTPGEVIVSSLKPTLAKNAPIITISYLGVSPEVAKNCLESVIDDIRVDQNLLTKSILQGKANQLVNLKQNLESAENTVKMLNKKNVSIDFSDSKSSAFTPLLAAILNKENEIKELRNQINDLDVQLLEPQTREVFLTAPIYAPQQKVSPKGTKIVLAGLMAGLFVGLLLMVGKRIVSTYKASNQC